MDLIREIFTRVKTIAVIGMKDNSNEPAYKVPYYMFKQGYKIHPVNPTRLGKKVLGTDFVSKVTDLSETVELVNIFRRPEFLVQHAEEVIAMKKPPKYVWFQLGIYNDEAAKILEERKIKVVQNICIMVEHIRIFNPT